MPEYMQQTHANPLAPVNYSQAPMQSPASEEQQAPAGKQVKNYKERKRRNVGGEEYVRDGSRMFRLSDVEAAGGDFNSLDPNSSLSWAGEGNKARRQATVGYKDRAWDPYAVQAGYKNWKQMRRALVASPQFQNASPEEQFYLWSGGPGVWQQYGGVSPMAPPVVPTGPNPNDRPKPIAPLTQSITNIPPKPVNPILPTTRPMQSAPGPIESPPNPANPLAPPTGQAQQIQQPTSFMQQRNKKDKQIASAQPLASPMGMY